MPTLPYWEQRNQISVHFMTHSYNQFRYVYFTSLFSSRSPSTVGLEYRPIGRPHHCLLLLARLMGACSLVSVGVCRRRL